jgi:hypothetical protein
MKFITDIGSNVDHISLGSTLDQPWINFGSTLDQPWINLGSTLDQM